MIERERGSGGGEEQMEEQDKICRWRRVKGKARACIGYAMTGEGGARGRGIWNDGGGAGPAAETQHGPNDEGSPLRLTRVRFFASSLDPSWDLAAVEAHILLR